MMCRWRKNLPLTWSNLVVFDREEYQKHEGLVLLGDKEPEEVWNEETCKLVESRQEEELATRRWRI